MTTLNYSGRLLLHSYGEADDILHLSSLDWPLANELQDEISGMMVTVRYWITDREATKEEAQESFIREVMGVADIKFGSVYSEITGYLWTNEDIVIGGHDLMAELSSHLEKWLILEIDVHEAQP